MYSLITQERVEISRKFQRLDSAGQKQFFWSNKEYDIVTIQFDIVTFQYDMVTLQV
jgi:hypothetical protein